MQLEETFLHFLLSHQQSRNRTLNFLILMESVLSTAKYIEYYYRMGAMHENLGETGTLNVQGESTLKLDQIANSIALHYLRKSGQVVEATSEEEADPIRMHADGRYLIYFDPLDGSSNVKHSLPVGFLFGIAKRNLGGDEDYHLRSGREFIAAGMFLIPTGTLTFALKDRGAWRFWLDEAGLYVRPTKIELPKTPAGWELCYNAAYRPSFSKPVQSWLQHNEQRCAFRYAGSLTVDFHRLLHSGGMFMYPALVNHPDPRKNYPNGKLRLMYEAAVVGFIAEQAGGAAINERGENILDVQPRDRHERSALFVGNRELVDSMRTILTPKGGAIS